MTGRTEIESAPVDAIAIRRKAEDSVGGVAKRIVMTRMIDESADAAEAGIVVTGEHRLDPRRRQPDVIVQKRDDVAARHP